MLGGDDNAVVADVVTLMADDEDLGGGDWSKTLVAVGIAECYNGRDASGSGSSESLGSGVNQLSTLRVASNNDLGGRAACSGLCGSQCQGLYIFLGIQGYVPG